MTIEQRIRTCMLIEKIYGQTTYSEKLGLENRSRFHGKNIEEKSSGDRSDFPFYMQSLVSR